MDDCPWQHAAFSDAVLAACKSAEDAAAAAEEAAAAAAMVEAMRLGPPRIDRAERTRLLDAGIDKFERHYGVRVLSDVARLWLDPHAHRRVKQRGEEWHRLRGQYMTGSRTGDVLGLNPYPSGTRRRVFLDYAGLNDDPFTGNAATQHGQFYEDCGVHAMEQLLVRDGGTPCVTLPFDFMVSTRVPHYAYSPDGITNEGDLVEVKCPYSRRIYPGYIPFHYLQGQIQYGLYALSGPATTGRCHFVEYKPFDCDDENSAASAPLVSVTTVGENSEWERRYRWVLDEFWGEVVAYRDDPLHTLPDHYVSEPRFEAWLKQRRLNDMFDFASFGGTTAQAAATSRLWPPTRTDIARDKRHDMESFAAKRRRSAAASSSDLLTPQTSSASSSFVTDQRPPLERYTGLCWD